MSLERDVDKYLAKQAKLNEKSETIINQFLKDYSKPEIIDLMNYIINTGAPKHSMAIKEFQKHYEQNILKVEDIKSYLTLQKIHKDKMKEALKEEYIQDNVEDKND